ncbi:MAG: zinc-dependent metalloprotease, partial [Nonlabens sp.]|nr:zinc-dependent metalloprotease [Nonlabens sp.]
SSHEVGHTLGLPHNMGSSIAYTVDNLRDPAFTKEYGTAPSIMDYARFNYVAQPGDGDVALMPNIGPYDKYSIAWGYKPILDKSAVDEKPILDAWILEKAGDPIYRFGRQQGNVVDHTSQTEDLGDDSMRASELGIANLKRIVPNLVTWTGKVGEDYDELDNMYGQVLGQYNRYMGHVAGNIGGVKETYKAYGQEGAVYEHASRDKQTRAMKFLQEQLFATPEWLIDNNIFNKVESDGAIDRIRSTQVRALNNVLDFGRMARLMENEEVNGAKAYGLYEMMKDLRTGLFSELPKGQKIDRYRRNLQRAYVERLEFIMKNEQRSIPAAFRSFAGQSSVDVAQSDIRPIVRAELKQLQRDARNASGRSSDALTRIHLQDLVERIELILDPK